ncbi:metallophosphoesterase [Candidatus Uabimicrobium sp. HlEnr_7]|uniref:metallophosphoesterase n=1 Tax=Candidatus Uabimicrobium helgolandensis TaxID=3095367 RepID=UPI003556E10C
MKKYTVLPEKGRLLISTDLHGNYGDFQTLKEFFFCQEEPVYWVILGDAVHGPSREHRKKNLYDYSDRSWDIVSELMDLMAKNKNIYYVLGNHDHGHIGGRTTRKFHQDEVAYLRSSITSKQHLEMQYFFQNSLLAIVVPNGLLLTHGSPDDTLLNIEDLNDISFDPKENNNYQNEVLCSFLSHYGQEEQVTANLLKRLSQNLNLSINVVIHGHDRSLDGWFVEGNNQLCPVIFGAEKQNKSYVFVDLSEKFTEVSQLEKYIFTIYH